MYGLREYDELRVTVLRFSGREVVVPAVLMEAPPRQSFRFVLRRYDFDHDFPLVENTYDESCASRSIEIDGVRAATMFVATEPFRERYTKLGWLDETARYDAWVAGAADREAAAAAAGLAATTMAAAELTQAQERKPEPRRAAR